MTDAVLRLWAATDRRLARVVRFFMGGIFVAMIAVVAYQVLARSAGFLPFYAGTEELARGLFIWLIMLGAALGVRDRIHFAADIVSPASEAGRRIIAVVIALVVCLISLLLLKEGWAFAASGLRRTSLATGFPAIWSYAAILVGGALMTVFSLAILASALRGADVPLRPEGR